MAHLSHLHFRTSLVPDIYLIWPASQLVSQGVFGIRTWYSLYSAITTKSQAFRVTAEEKQTPCKTGLAKDECKLIFSPNCHQVSLSVCLSSVCLFLSVCSEVCHHFAACKKEEWVCLGVGVPTTTKFDPENECYVYGLWLLLLLLLLYVCFFPLDITSYILSFFPSLGTCCSQWNGRRLVI